MSPNHAKAEVDKSKMGNAVKHTVNFFIQSSLFVFASFKKTSPTALDYCFIAMPTFSLLAAAL